MISDISPMRVGQTDPPALFQIQTISGQSVPLDAGTTFVLYIRNPKTNQSIQGTGTWDTTNIATQGVAIYNWTVNDTTKPGPGDYELIAQYTRPNGKVGFLDPVPWTIIPEFILS